MLAKMPSSELIHCRCWNFRDLYKTWQNSMYRR